ncbi:MAG: MazG family protein, partial [Armatimonadetes bacterium]|nr:MazG family protein [Armatimonadota bacterium]
MGKRKPGTDNALFSELVAIMARLRSPSGCPWDREQDHRSLRPCLLEETYEVFEAIDRDDPDALCQELGDVLLQVIFHAQLAEEAGRFDIGEVVQGLRDKLVARHPLVFGDSSAETPEEVLHQWDSLKR